MNMIYLGGMEILMNTYQVSVFNNFIVSVLPVKIANIYLMLMRLMFFMNCGKNFFFYQLSRVVTFQFISLIDISQAHILATLF